APQRARSQHSPAARAQGAALEDTMPPMGGFGVRLSQPIRARPTQVRIPHVSEVLWIDQPAELLRRLQSAPSRVGLDTEFIRERTFWPRLALVQIAVGGDVLLVDALVPGMPEAIAA